MQPPRWQNQHVSNALEQHGARRIGSFIGMFIPRFWWEICSVKNSRASCCNLRLIYWCWWCEIIITEAAATLSPQVLARSELWSLRHIQRTISPGERFILAEGVNGDFHFFNFLSMWDVAPASFSSATLFLWCRTSRILHICCFSSEKGRFSERLQTCALQK